MARLLIHVEGQTEESFVNAVLRGHLGSIGYESISARIIGTARARAKRGGIIPWPQVRDGIIRNLREDSSIIVTTMVDYYGMPNEGPGGWPDRLVSQNKAFLLKAQTVEDAMLADVVAQMGASFDASRFIPFVLMHEFEALLFSDCEKFANTLDQPELAERLQVIRDQFSSPEEINDSPITAPSKRILNLYKGYEKPLFGTRIAAQIGIEGIRKECKLFDKWIERIEGLIEYN